MAELLSTAATAASSSDIALADGQSATLFLKNANSAGGAVGGGNAIVQIKSADGYYYDIGMLTERSPYMHLEMPGTYRVKRPIADVAYGIDYVMTGVSGGLAGGIAVGAIANVSNSFAVPNSAATYAVGDLIANSATAGSVTPLTFAGVARVAAGAASVIKARLSKTGTGTTGAAFILHLYSASPTPSNGDDGAWLTNQAANYLGAFEFSLANMRVFTDGVSCNGITLTGYPVTFDLSSGTTIYGLLEARGAYVRTAAETFTVTLEVEQE